MTTDAYTAHPADEGRPHDIPTSEDVATEARSPRTHDATTIDRARDCRPSPVPAVSVVRSNEADAIYLSGGLDAPRGPEWGIDVANEWRQLNSETTGLTGRRLRVLTDVPTDDAGDSQDQLPSGITDVISVRDTVSPNLTVRVHPVGDPTTIAYIRYDQLAVYDHP